MKDFSQPGVTVRDVLGTPVQTFQDGRGGVQYPLLVKTASFTVTKEQSGTTFLCDAADLVATLPATEAGLHYRFLLGTAGLSAGTGLQISPAAADAINGNGLTSVDDKDLILGGAADREGDMVELIADGVDGWFICALSGTWTKQA